MIASLISCSVTLNTNDGVVRVNSVPGANTKKHSVLCHGRSGSNMLICYWTLGARAHAWTKDCAAPCVSPFSWVTVFSHVCSSDSAESHSHRCLAVYLCLICYDMIWGAHYWDYTVYSSFVIVKAVSNVTCLSKHAALLKWPGLWSAIFSFSSWPSCIRGSAVKCFKANMNFRLLSGPLHIGLWCLLTEGKSLLASLRRRGVKIGKSDSTGYCSQRLLMIPGSFPESVLHARIHKHI